MGDISDNFSRWEFECSCGCGFKSVDIQLTYILEKIRNYFNRIVNVNCGCRCKNHNASLPNSSPTSAHVQGLAADIKVDDIEPEDVYDYVERIFEEEKITGGIGIYNTFVHVDISDGNGNELSKRPSRWDKRSK
jgi:uncharacterized protein YcbK (DUF882 family)